MELIKNKERLREVTAYPIFRLMIKWFCRVIGALGASYGFYLIVLGPYGSFFWGGLTLFSVPALCFLVNALLSMFCDIADATLARTGRQSKGRAMPSRASAGTP